MHHKSNSLCFVVASLTFFVALFTGCGSSSHSTTPAGGTSTSFSVASSTPAASATQVATNAPILITFSGPANAATVNTTDIKLTGPNNSAVAGAVTYNATTYVATFTPAAALAASATYTLTVSGVTSSSGADMASTFTSTFTTAPPTTGGGTAQFQATFLPDSPNKGSGQISITTSGSVTIQLTGAAAGTTYAAQFCPSYNIYMQKPYPCISLGNVATNASGSATATTQFPQPGSWAGDFQLNSGSTIEYETGLGPESDANGVTQVYTAQLQSDSTVNGKGDNSPQPTNPLPLTSGSVVYSTASNGTLQFTLTGTSPDTTFTAAESGVLGGSQTYVLYNTQKQSAFTTNAQGNVTFTVLQDGTAGDLFLADPQTNKAGFIGGFSVPAPAP